MATTEAAKKLLALVEKQHALPEDVDGREAISAVLCVLTQRMGTAPARRAFSAAPAAIRSMMGRCILHGDERAEVFALDVFLRRVADHLDVTPHTGRRMIRVVFTALHTYLSPEQTEQASGEMPADIRALWLPD